MGDNVSRFELEDEWWAVRAMRHVFRVKPNASQQAWTTLLMPVLPCSYPSQWVLTLDSEDELLPRQKQSAPGKTESPEFKHAQATGLVQDKPGPIL
jgi:hypothetical protein